MPFEKHSDDLRQRVIAEALGGRKSRRQLAKEFGVAVGTVRRWVDSAGMEPYAFQKQQQMGAPSAPQERMLGTSGPMPEENLWKPVYELVVELLEGAAAVAALPKNPIWLETQSASELGNFLSISVDKATTILEALERGWELRKRAEETEDPRRLGSPGDSRQPAPVGAR